MPEAVPDDAISRAPNVQRKSLEDRDDIACSFRVAPGLFSMQNALTGGAPSLLQNDEAHHKSCATERSALFTAVRVKRHNQPVGQRQARAKPNCRAD